MHSVVWLLLCSCMTLTFAAPPENHRTSHRPRLSSRLLPSRTATTTVAPRSTVAAASTTAAVATESPSTTPAPLEERKEVDELSTQILAQQHQQQLALDALKSPQPTNFSPFGNSYQPASQNDIQQLLAIMQAHQQPSSYPSFPPPTFNPQFGTTGLGNYYGQSNGYGQQNIFGAASDPYSQYNPSQYSQNPYSQQYNPYQQQQVQYTQPQRFPYQFSAGTPLPYNPPPSPTFVFKDNQYHIQGPNGQFHPINLASPSAAPVSESNANTVPLVETPQSDSPVELGVKYATSSHNEQPVAQQQYATTNQNAQPVAQPQYAPVNQNIQPIVVQQQYSTSNQNLQAQQQYATQNTQPVAQAQYATQNLQPASQAQYATQNLQPVAQAQYATQNLQPVAQAQYYQPNIQPATQQVYLQQPQYAQIQPPANYVQVLAPTTQPVYTQAQATPLVQHVQPQQVTVQPQPSSGTHSFFQEQVIQQVSQTVEPPKQIIQSKPAYSTRNSG